MWQQWEKEHRRGKVMGGIAIVLVGSLFLARELGVIFPEWLFTWKTLLITIGLFAGIKHGFRNAGWLVPVAIGGVYLASDLYPELAIRPLIWPVIIIFIGLVIIFKPHRSRHAHWRRWHRHRHRHQHRYYQQKYNFDFTKAENTSDDSFDFVAFMSGIKKNILTKNFRNGEVTVVFGGAKVDFSQADLDYSPTLEVTNVLGGTQLIIPANWEIRSEIVCVFGNVEDKRPQIPAPGTDEGRKVLVLKGTIFMGGLEIRSFN